MAKVSEMVLLTSMPMSCAAPLSSLTARMALPILPRWVKSVSATVIRTLTTMETSAVALMVRPPMTMGSAVTTEVNVLGLEPKSRRAPFSRK